jgi:hypothetical protein
LLDQLVRAEAEQGEHGIVGLVDLSLEIRHEHRIRRVLDEALGVGTRLVELPHVAQDADRSDDDAARVSQRRCVERGGDQFSGRATRLEPDVAGDAPRDDLAKDPHEFSGLVVSEEPGDGLLENLVTPQAEQARDRFVRLEDLAFQIADKDRVRSVRDDDVGGKLRPDRALSNG